MLARLFALLRGLVVSTIFVSIWIWFLPRWVARAPLRPLRPMGYVPMVIGGAIALRCVWDFAWRGAGTPAPFDAPRRLVVSGLYRFVRNPMYIGLGIFMIGEAILFPSITVQSRSQSRSCSSSSTDS
jgi:protein-S-isoprenylcysteine O-methyltransferase Ste14